ncbi:hypothetical protein [Nocardiopsis suaedae]|uniref:Uncharacterized protein n=1 Tax=Nocardiopsis suaedae TaxID=3018444 RepID=A0ABT4TTN3_9ACTN|nr:hypothetical protein [Nocardiopsis suaedae]MDA2807997.1 hypothetical protein [Nocardiopsis suaedae]
MPIPEYGVLSGPDGGWSLTLEPGEWDISGAVRGDETATERVVLEDERVEGVELRFP